LSVKWIAAVTPARSACLDDDALPERKREAINQTVLKRNGMGSPREQQQMGHQQRRGLRIVNNNYIDQAKDLLTAIGVYQLSEGVWAFTDVHTANHAYIHHSREPVALAAYAAVNPTFAAGRFPSWALIDMVDKVPCMDGTQHTALAMVCGASIPTFPSASERGNIFGQAVSGIVEAYSLEGCFEHVECAYGSPGRHYNLQPRGFDWAGEEGPLPESLKAMRKNYRAMSSLQQIMVLTIMHLYNQGTDKSYLTGGCPTKIHAAEAMDILRRNGPALSAWGYMVTHYAGW
jgi:hypothetical protein